MSDPGTFRLRLEPVDPDRTPLLCALSVVALDEVIWPIAGDPDHSVEIPIDDLFAHLVEFWKPLLLRQTYPFALTPQRPVALANTAARSWEEAPQEQIDEEASELDAFEEAHNLACAFGGLFDLPPLWLIRQGDQMLCDTGRRLVSLPYSAVVKELTTVGNQIAERLLSLDADKWERIVALWYDRDNASDVALVSWAASLEKEVAAKLIGDGLIEAPKSFPDAANDNNELVIAARVAGALPYDQIVEILDVARGFEFHRSEPLDLLSEKVARRREELLGEKPHIEGQALANFVRQEEGLGSREKCDIFRIVQRLGIEIRIDAIGPETFDGLAIAGPRFGPGAFINRNGRRIRNPDHPDLRNDAGARVNLAHELCHLLVDRDHPLSAVEVMRSRMPATVETRAKAFAGEILLPSMTAARVWEEAGAPTEREPLNDVLQRLADEFGVSYSVASWKLEHGARWGLEHMSGEDYRKLQSMLDVLAQYR